jgi:hypothetical protein
MNKIGIALLSLWLGAALFFSAVVAPAVFGVLRQFDIVNAGEIAGAIVNRSLAVVNLSGFLVGLLLLLMNLVQNKQRKVIFLFQTVSLLVVTATTALGHWVVAAKMHALRVAMDSAIDRVDISDPRRIAFDQLHGYSVALLSAAMLAAILSIVLFMLRPRVTNPNL